MAVYKRKVRQRVEMIVHIPWNVRQDVKEKKREITKVGLVPKKKPAFISFLLSHEGLRTEKKIERKSWSG